MQELLSLFEQQRHMIEFFQTKLSFIDFLIIGLGLFLILGQLLKRFTTFSGHFYKKAKEDPVYLVRTEVKLEYIASLIEVLPMLGLFGTVWGLLNALVVIAETQAPTIKDIATNIAPALSTTFFGLLFAIINLVFYNILHAYFTELIAWCRANLPETSASSQQHKE